jgi:hypothetical protein
MRWIVPALLFVLVFLSQNTDAQTLPNSVGPQPGKMAIVKDGGVLYGLQLSQRQSYKWQNNRWVPFGQLDVSVPDRRLPYLSHAVAHKREQGGYYVGVSGFGHLWEYRQGRLERLDTTFFAGSNFGADRFVYHDTLYSHGGYGFWLNHGVLTYFDPRYKEWERTALTGYSGPVQPYPISGFSGKNKRWVWSVSSYREMDAQPMFEPNGLVYELDLVRRSMKTAGHVRHSIWKQLGSPIAAWDSVVLVEGLHGGVLIDMAKNEVRLVPENVMVSALLAPLDDWGAGCVALDDTLEIFSIKDRARSQVMVHDRIALRDLWEASTPLGSFLEPVWINGLKRNFWLPLLTLVIGLAAWWVGKQGPSKPRGVLFFYRSLDSYEQRLLGAMLAAPGAKKWTSHELDAVLQIQDKTWDNQRKIRKTTLNDLNNKALQFLNVSPLISDERDLEDRREKRYFVANEAIAWKKELVDLLHPQQSPT